MNSLGKRAAAVLFIAAGLSLVSLGLCLITQPVYVGGIAAAHQLAQARRDFRRHATMEVAETASIRAGSVEAREPAIFQALPTLSEALVLRAAVQAVANPSTPRRFLLRRKPAPSGASADDIIS